MEAKAVVDPKRPEKDLSSIPSDPDAESPPEESQLIRDLKAEVEKWRIRKVNLEKEIERIDTEADVSTYRQDLTKLTEKLNSVKENFVKAQRNLQAAVNKQRFDKTAAFRNIRELLKTSKVKIGQIEKEAGCQPGYMSRLEKPGNTSVPGIEFIVTAAKMLDVPVDLLLFGNISEITETETFLLDFMNGMIEDTRADIINWTRETPGMLDDVMAGEPTPDGIPHPLFKAADDSLSDQPVMYASRFYPKEPVAFGNCYHTQMTETDEQMYLMKCYPAAGHSQNEEFYEIYLVRETEDGSSDVMPICCSIQTCETVTQCMIALYKEIEIAASHVHIGSDAREIMSKYLRGRREDKLPDIRELKSWSNHF